MEYRKRGKVYAIEYTGDNSIIDEIKYWVKDNNDLDVKSHDVSLSLIVNYGSFTSNSTVYPGEFVVYDVNHTNIKLFKCQKQYL
jgi:hypothetical protein